MIDSTNYQHWRREKLAGYPLSPEKLTVDIGGLMDLGKAEQAAIIRRCDRYNMAIYRCRDTSADRVALKNFAANFGLTLLDHHLCANDDGVSELMASASGLRSGYVPYSNRSLSWHTDGYYNEVSRTIRAVILHCVNRAATGGENALLDPDLVFIALRDKNPEFIAALEHPECMTIPANPDAGGKIRPAVTGPVFSRDKISGELHMRFSARKKNIIWRDDPVTRAARTCLAELLGEKKGAMLHYCLRPGEGLISNNVLHNRTAFEDDPTQGRLLYRARFFQRIDTLN